MPLPPNPNDPNQQQAGGQTTNQSGTNNPNPGGAGMNAETAGVSDQGGDVYFGSSTSGSGVQNAYTRQHTGGANDQAIWGYSIPTSGSFIYADPTAFQDPNSQAIYSQLNNTMNNRANQQSFQAATTALAPTAQIAPQQMISGAQIAPQMMINAPTLNTASDTQYQQAQNQAINALNAQAQGIGPSVATQTAQQQRDANIAASMAMLGGQRGGSPGGGARAAQMAGANANQQAAATATLGRAQEAMNAQNQLTGALSGARSQAQATNTTQAQLEATALGANQGAFNAAGTQQASLNQAAGLSNQALSGQVSQNSAQMQNANQLQQGNMDQAVELANQNAFETQNSQNNSLLNAAMGQEMQINQQDISNSAAYQQMIAQEQEANQSLNYNKDIASNNANSGLMGAAMSAAGGLLAMSDRREKTDIRSGSESVADFLDIMRRKLRAA